jgi:hypothetical protein
MNEQHIMSFFFQWLFQPIQGPGLLFISIIIFTDGRATWTSDQFAAGLYLNTGKRKHRINAYTHQTSMSCVGFEPTIPASERAKRDHALDRGATVTSTT